MFPAEKRLVVMRAVQVNEVVAEGFKSGKGGWRAVDELFVGTGSTDNSSQNQGIILTRVETQFFKTGVDRGRVIKPEDRFDRTAAFPCADATPIGTLAEDELESPDDHRFAGPGFSGDSDQTGFKFPLELIDEGQVPDMEDGEHGGCGDRLDSVQTNTYLWLGKFQVTFFEFLLSRGSGRAEFHRAGELTSAFNEMAEFEVTFLGTATSVGIPMIGCSCPTCSSEDVRDRRSRSSICVQTPEAKWVVDTGPDFRMQCLREGITALDAVLYTHAHMDHVAGFDELRRFTLGAEASLPIHARAETLAALQRTFSYAFDGNHRYPGYFKPDPRVIDGSFQIGETEVEVLEVTHGRVDTIGFLFRRAGRPVLAYIPDCKKLSEEALRAIAGVETLIIDGLRYTPHPTHMNFDEVLALIASIEIGEAYLTHFSCEVGHVEGQARLPAGVKMSYDGLRLNLC